MIEPLLAGLALGAASSAHCAAMCGPLVLTASRLAATSWRARLRHALLHHAGRTLVYTLLALPAGLAGQWLVLHGWERGLAIGAGIVLLAALPRAVGVPLLDRIAARVSATVGRLFGPVLRWASTRPVGGPLAIGALNGLLPCGLVYAAMTTALAFGDLLAAMLVMIGFGAGTSVVLVALTMGARSLPVSWRLRLRPAGPLVLAVTAVLLIMRGVSDAHRHADAPAARVHVHVHE